MQEYRIKEGLRSHSQINIYDMADQNVKAFFSNSVMECTNSLYGLAFRLTKNRTDAEDLVAESVAKAWKSIEKLEDRNRFRPWIFRILRNCFISEYRKKSSHPDELAYDGSSENEEDDITALLIDQSDDFLNWWGNPEREYINNLLGEDILSAIDNLPESFRMTVLLINVEGFTYDEAAEILGVPPGTVRSRMKRGRTLLQKELWEQAKETGLLGEKH